MNGAFKIKASDDTVAVLTLTGQVGDFRALAGNLRAFIDPNKLAIWPICDLMRQIDDLVLAAETSFYSQGGEQ
jgi:hypothetical protein